MLAQSFEKPAKTCLDPVHREYFLDALASLRPILKTLSVVELGSLHLEPDIISDCLNSDCGQC